MRPPRQTASIGRLWKDDGDVNDSNQWFQSFKSLNKLREKLRTQIMRYLGDNTNPPVTPDGQRLWRLFSDPVGDAQGRSASSARNAPPLPMPTAPNDGGALLQTPALPVIGLEPGALIGQYMRICGFLGQSQPRRTAPQEDVDARLTERIESLQLGREGVPTADLIADLTIDMLELMRLYIPPEEEPGLWAGLLQRLVDISRELSSIIPPLATHPQYQAYEAQLRGQITECDNAGAFAVMLARRQEEFFRQDIFQRRYLEIPNSRTRPRNVKGNGDCFFYALAWVINEPVRTLLGMMNTRQIMSPEFGSTSLAQWLATRKSLDETFQPPEKQLDKLAPIMDLSVQDWMADELRRIIITYMWVGGTASQKVGPPTTWQDHLAMRKRSISQLSTLFRSDLEYPDYAKLDAHRLRYDIERRPVPPRRPGAMPLASHYLLDPERQGTLVDGYFVPDETEEQYEARVEDLYQIYLRIMRRGATNIVMNGRTGQFTPTYADDSVVHAAAVYFKMRIHVHVENPVTGLYSVDDGAVHGSLTYDRWVNLLLCFWDNATNRPDPSKEGNHYVPLVELTPTNDPLASDFYPYPDRPQRWTASTEVDYTAPAVVLSAADLARMRRDAEEARRAEQERKRLEEEKRRSDDEFRAEQARLAAERRAQDRADANKLARETEEERQRKAQEAAAALDLRQLAMLREARKADKLAEQERARAAGEEAERERKRQAKAAEREARQQRAIEEGRARNEAFRAQQQQPQPPPPAPAPVPAPQSAAGVLEALKRLRTGEGAPPPEAPTPPPAPRAPVVVQGVTVPDECLDNKGMPEAFTNKQREANLLECAYRKRRGGD